MEDGRVLFSGGTAYRLLVLPSFETMTPALLRKIKHLVEQGATVVGAPPRKSPSLMDYPQCDQQVALLAAELWGDEEKPPTEVVERQFGRGRVVWGGELRPHPVDTPASQTIQAARWIWYPESNPAVAVKPCTRYFCRTFDMEAEKHVRSARLEITADNEFQVWVNGREVTEGDNFHVIYTAEVHRLLKSGDNVLAVAATNSGEQPNPAGLIACLHVLYEDGSEQTIPTDGQWRTARDVPPGWPSPAIDAGAGWAASTELGAATMNPWKLESAASDRFPELYPDYEATVRLLSQNGLPPDFESDGPIRFTHRRMEPWDLFFVANREPEAVTANCLFRVAGKHPELWDPRNGTIRDLPDYVEQAGRIRVPLRFAPHESYFVVFREPAQVGDSVSRVGKNFPELRALGRIDGSWDVSFDPSLGGPRQATFAELEDWSQRPESGIKYYSGIATYRKAFDLPESIPLDGSPILLDLGVVHSIARVRLNGRDLGVVWCAPWRVDLSPAAQAKNNQLEIEVANLWPNRLIGDKQLPPNRQVAWTSFNPYRENSPLLPSGLLGPVTLVRADAVEQR